MTNNNKLMHAANATADAALDLTEITRAVADATCEAVARANAAYRAACHAAACRAAGPADAGDAAIDNALFDAAAAALAARDAASLADEFHTRAGNTAYGVRAAAIDLLEAIRCS